MGLGVLSALNPTVVLGTLSAAGNVVSTAMNNKAQKKADQRANNYNLAMWNMQNEYNSPVNQMARYAAAGLNPNLIYGQGSSGNASAMPHVQVTPRRYADPSASLSAAVGLMSTAMQMEDARANIRMKDAQTERILGQKETDDVKRAQLFVDKLQQNRLIAARIEQMRRQGTLTYEQARHLRLLSLHQEEKDVLAINTAKEKLNELMLERDIKNDPLNPRNLPKSMSVAAGVAEKLFTSLLKWDYNREKYLKRNPSERLF